MSRKTVPSRCRRPLLVAFAPVLLVTLPVWARDMEIDEDALFADTAIVVDSAKIVNTEEMAKANEDRKSIGFSGDITSAVTATATRDWAKHGFHREETGLSPFVVGNLFIDVRLPKGVKAFAACEAAYASVDTGTAFSIQEFFLDINLRRRVYLRTGKQILQWGRCSFWNPTDLVNVERKLFVPRLGLREGSFGLKAHAPIGSKWNIYGFADLNNVEAVDSVAGVLKAEVLLGKVETSVAVWGKPDTKPVFGLDLSTSVLDVLVAAEVGLFHGSRFRVLDLDNALPSIMTLLLTAPSPQDIDPSLFAGALTRSHKTIWAPRAALSLTWMLDLLDVDDRLMITGEFYYNHFGYTRNVIRDLADFVESMPAMPDSILPGPVNAATMLYGSGLYEPNSLSRYYAAFFAGISRFVVSDMSLTINGLANLVDHSGMLSAGVTYRSINDWSVGLLLNTFLGGKNCEYTVTGNAVSAQLTVGVVF